MTWSTSERTRTSHTPREFLALISLWAFGITCLVGVTWSFFDALPVGEEEQAAALPSDPGADPMHPNPKAREWRTPHEVSEAFAGTRVGNQTVPEACEKNGGDTLARCLARLARVGITPGPTDTIKDVAKRYDKPPIEVVQLMLID